MIDRAPRNGRTRSTGKEMDEVAQEACLILRSEMVRRAVSFRALAELLNAREDGPLESVQTLINKVNRGRFSFAFFIRCCRAMGVQTVDVAAVAPHTGEEPPDLDH